MLTYLRMQTQSDTDAEAATVAVALGNVAYILVCWHFSVSVSLPLLLRGNIFKAVPERNMSCLWQQVMTVFTFSSNYVHLCFYLTSFSTAVMFLPEIIKLATIFLIPRKW